MELDTDEGIQGIGVTFFGGPLTPALREGVDNLCELVIGEDPMGVEAIVDKLRLAASGSGPEGIFTLARLCTTLSRNMNFPRELTHNSVTIIATTISNNTDPIPITRTRFSTAHSPASTKYPSLESVPAPDESTEPPPPPPPPSRRPASQAVNPSTNHFPISKGWNRTLFIPAKERDVGRRYSIEVDDITKRD